MLVITRRSGQSFSIGDGIRVDVVSVVRGQVRIGIVAPKEVRIERMDRATEKAALEAQEEATHGN